MKKVKVDICVGTTCFVLGAAELQTLDRFLPIEWRDQVEIIGSTCQGWCKERNYGQAPFVRINDEVMAQATIGAIIERIKQLLA